MRNLANRSKGLVCFLTALSTWGAVAPAAAEEPETSAEKAEAPAARGELEVAIGALVEPLARRVVVRNDQNLYNVWLISKLDVEKAYQACLNAVSANRRLAGNLRIERVTPIDADRSYVLDVVGGQKPYRVRLTRHLGGSMLELENAGAARDAPRWAPPYRPRPVLLPHGQNR